MNNLTTKSISILLIGLICLLFNAGCESPSQKSRQSINLTKESQRAKEKATYLSSAQQYLNQAKQAEAPLKQEYEILAADMFVKAGNISQADSILEGVSESALDEDLKTLKLIVQADLAIEQRSPKSALQLLEQIPSSSLATRSTRSRVLFLQARAFEMQKNHLSAARARSDLDSLLVDSQSQFINRRAIQQSLSQLSTSSLNQAAHRERYPFSGWLSLAFIEKNNQTPLEKSQAIQQWQQHYPQHPAQALLPEQHRYDANQYAWQQSNTQKIALLLPLSGQHAKAARTIREGYLAAYYEKALSQGQRPMIQVYDTNAEDVVRVYQRAVQEGADFVVGPLVKEDVVRLSQIPPYSIKTPILALNEHPNVRSRSRSFVQFSLAPENEADQITEKARRLGYRSASIVVPDNQWGQRLLNRFQSNWQNVGGQIVSTLQIDPHKDLSQQVRKVLAVEQSQSRSSAIKQIIKEKVDYQLRRRNDVDVVFMALPPELARQVKPLFDFYYATDIPILATSSVYAGFPNPKRDRDMNGLQFVDMPMVADSKQSRHLKQLMKSDNNYRGEAKRLFAMGADAYELTRHFTQLQRSAGSGIPGATGELSLTPDNRVKRDLTWIKISNGSPVIVH